MRLQGSIQNPTLNEARDPLKPFSFHCRIQERSGEMHCTTSHYAGDNLKIVLPSTSPPISSRGRSAPGQALKPNPTSRRKSH